MADNLVDYFHALTDKEIDAIIEAYNYVHNDSSLNAGVIPFMNRKLILGIIQEYIYILDDDNDDDDDDTDYDKWTELSTTLEVLEVILSRVRLEPLNKAKVNKWRKRIRARIEGNLT